MGVPFRNGCWTSNSEVREALAIAALLSLLQLPIASVLVQS